MKKNMIRNGLVIGMVLTMLVSPVSVFAQTQVEDGDVFIEESNPFIEEESKEVKNPFRQEEKEKVDFRTIRLEEVELYSPESLDIWTTLFESADILKAQKESIKAELEILVEEVLKPFIEAQKAEDRLAVQTYTQELKTKVENEEITREEAAVLFDEFIFLIKEKYEELKAEKELNKAQNEIDKVYFTSLRESKKALNQEIKAAKESALDEIIPALLEQVLEINQELEAHAIEVLNSLQEKIDRILAL